VLIQVGVEGYAFRHALLAEAVYDDLLPGEKARIHAAYAQGGADARPALSSRLVDGTRPSWPDMLAPPTISTRRSGQASAPVTTRCRSVVRMTAIPTR